MASTEVPSDGPSLQSTVENPTDTVDPTMAGNKRKSLSSPAWDHFHKIEGCDPKNPRATCNYCPVSYACASKSSGTSNMLSHMKVCKKNPNNKVVADKSQQILSFKDKELVAVSFSLKACRDALSRMIIIDELPFSFVEGEGFRHFVKVIQPKFTNLPYRTQVGRDCIELYMEERRKLKSFLHGNRICITTDTWTSIQNLNYMVLTAHFIDSDWNLQKRILNFCLVPNHKGETIGKMVEKCLLNWGVYSLFTVTVDNASSNSVAIDYLKKSKKIGKDTVMGHKYLHMRCCAHILNLIVCDGPKDVNDAIFRVRTAVRYVRSSPSRLARFKECVKEEQIECTKLLCLDVATRWNATFMMLEVAEKFQSAFEILELEDPQYTLYFDDDKIKGPPTLTDWNSARLFVKFLRVFYKATLRFSGSRYVTSNNFFSEILIVQKKLIQFNGSEDARLRSMALRMQTKFDKYWDMDKINILLYVGVVLDPRFKMKYVSYSFKQLYEETKANDEAKKVKDALVALYEWYVGHYPSSNQPPIEVNVSQTTSRMDVDDDEQDPTILAAEFQQHLLEEDNLQNKSEVERFLAETNEVGGDKFDILGWWKINASRYRILSLVARDVLAVPISSVASESAFSTGGRILDPFRSSLAPNTVEALICAQDWLRSPSIPINLRQSMDDIEQYDKLDGELFGSTSSEPNAAEN